MALPLRPRRPLPTSLPCLHPQQLRHFSQTHPAHSLKSAHALKSEHSKLPEYPYGASLWYKKSNRGLYGGLKVRSGNNVSDDTETKTRRKWHPNIQSASLYSHALEQYVKLQVATRVLRTVDKCGGLDEYLVGEKPARIRELGMKGWALRCKIMGTLWWRERQEKARESMGLSPVRKYVPDQYEDEAGEYLVGLFGEKLKIEDMGEQFWEGQEEGKESAEDKIVSVSQTGEVLQAPKSIQFRYTSQKAKRKQAVQQAKAEQLRLKRAAAIKGQHGKQRPVRSTDLQTFVQLEAEQLRRAKVEESTAIVAES